MNWWRAFAPFCAARAKQLPARPASDHDEVLKVGDIELSLGTRNVTCGSKPVELTSVEFNVLELLLRNAGSVVTREQIAEVALGRPLNAFDRSVDVHVSRLRKKLGGFPGTEDLIRPIRGIGYFLAAAHAGKEPGMNRRLFWKIFLPFWVAQALLLGCSTCACITACTPRTPGGCSRNAAWCRLWRTWPSSRYEDRGAACSARAARPVVVAPSRQLLAARRRWPRIERTPAAAVRFREYAQRALRHEGMVRPDEAVVIVAPRHDRVRGTTY